MTAEPAWWDDERRRWLRTRAAQRACQPSGTDLLAVTGSVADLVGRQCGVATRAQLRAAGVTDGQIRAAIAARRWQAFGRTTVVMHNAALTERQREWVAVLLVPKPAALAGLTGACLAGLSGFTDDRVHVLVEHATHTGLPSWIAIHESRRFSPSDIVALQPPRTAPARCVVDAATWSRSARRACAILCAAVQQRITTSNRLAAALTVAGSVRHVQVMRAVLGDISGGGHTLAEIDLAPLARAAGLAPPRRQALRREPNGRVRYVDAEFDLPDGTVLAVEIDGAMHLRPTTWWDDLDRQNELVIAGSPVLRFASATLRLEPTRVSDQLRRIRLAHTPR